MENSNVFSTKSSLKKLDRKRRKCEHVVEKETGIICTSSPTKNLVICNAGLVNGLSEMVVAENFLIYGSIECITMIPGKSCCIITFKEIDSSFTAYVKCSGVLNIGQNNKPVILSFCQYVPEKYLEPISYKLPAGLLILNDFISEDEEALLLSLCNFDVSLETNNLKFRKVEHYGYEFRYDINNVDKNKPLEKGIPKECNFLWERLKQMNIHVKDFIPDQLTINYYNPGQGIPSHVDTHSAFEDLIVSLSLRSAVVMEFKKNDEEHISVLLPQRSLTIMSGESRYNWKHGITPRQMDVIQKDGQLNVFYRKPRLSFTFRKIRKGACNCEYINNCDSYLDNKESNRDSSIAEALENTHVHEVYENIAAHFSETRHKPWPEVLNFIQTLGMGSILVDVGCGNGKYLGHRQDIYEVGCDVSYNLLKTCKEKGCDAFNCNCLCITLREEIADAVISIAVIHHLANEERRLEAIKEMIRILKINGRALIYVWAKDQNMNNNKTTYLKQDRKNRKKDAPIYREQEQINEINEFSLPVHTNRSQFKHNDVLVPWKLKNKESHNITTNLFLRYYHVFEENELENLCRTINNIKIIRSYYDEGNWCILLQKVNK